MGGAAHADVTKFTDRDVLGAHYNTKIIQTKVYKITTKRGVKITGL